MPSKSPHAGTGTDAVVITTSQIEDPSSRYLCDCETPATLDVYANGRYCVYACPKCVGNVPGYGGGLRLDDVIPDSWEVIAANGNTFFRLGLPTPEDVERILTLWGDDRLKEGYTIRPTTARTLFGL